MLANIIMITIIITIVRKFSADHKLAIHFVQGCDYRQTFHPSFPSLVGLSLSLISAGTLLIPPGSTPRWGGDVPGVDLMASQVDFWFHTTTFV